ncbi:MAG: flagellar biosynthetic protein FliR [Spirochaetes bacterium GWD1_61_31]|nr:MAG: flagellar biosynthetic protein FliR [Spirochaetes bacterium GWB1_60_80]OHD28527.1 MAG: flagellar biosynthetic protein FliR [Spirochaetes bacterium GWC1_61_12]OHD42190.1 MAG: flagellar biosynthetic protein FliR [Spirochaetes bacterium GWD1_61_31]OHD44520.1 MAG: flagellar biosynthetic protein FliR [Spirochaetes bacterium GWE1_60_18]OHD59328.1 MAG: flagellar biosynthetic protein FliR [Spirochaetes bacterium GWF1_60_12]HAP43176.1 flagellar biosynthetic protein FliR [Spirochaetaceae bacteri
MFSQLVADADIFFLMAVRVLALIQTAPLMSGEAVPQVAKIGLAGMVTVAIFPWLKEAGYPIPDSAVAYFALIIGEAMIGIIIGFFLSIVYATFTTAGQFFALQMGFGASETYDPLSEISIPVVGQFLNLIAMFIFVATSGFQRLFLLGVQGSFQALRAVDLLERRDNFMAFVTSALGGLFANALILSFPIFGTLLLVSVGMGLLTKAAPQMNLLTESFPVSILTAFVLLAIGMPFMIEAFSGLIDASFDTVGRLIAGAAP